MSSGLLRVLGKLLFHVVSTMLCLPRFAAGRLVSEFLVGVGLGGKGRMRARWWTKVYSEPDLLKLQRAFSPFVSLWGIIWVLCLSLAVEHRYSGK